MIFQDGQAFVGADGSYRIPFVFDNLIYRREMPVTIAVFINPGHTPEQMESTSTNWGDSINNRATEYNELNDKYSRLIVDELLPVLEKDYKISKNPDDRAIAGASSGAASTSCGSRRAAAAPPPRWRSSASRNGAPGRARRPLHTSIYVPSLHVRM